MFVNGANGVLREKLKISPTHNFSGAGLWAKTAVYAAASKGGLLTRERSKRRPITLRLDPAYLASPPPTAGEPLNLGVAARAEPNAPIAESD